MSKNLLSLMKKIGVYSLVIAIVSLLVYGLNIFYKNNKTFKEFVDSSYSFWNYPIYQEANLTLGKLIFAITLISFGFWLSKLISSKLLNLLINKTKLEDGAKAAIQNLSYYVFVLIFALIALRVAEVPLTIFTIFGGALAIGVGFGSQTILQNFISGIILQVERPVKVGDVIEIEGLVGKVEEIGGRSTKILAQNNTHIIMPNSEFLNKKVINWTLTDNVIRSTINLGLHYKTDPREAKDVIEKTLEQIEIIKQTPKPKILFSDFGDNALHFKVVYWASMNNQMDKLELESNFRLALFKKLKEAKIEIPYPQRTISWDSPLELKTKEEKKDE